MEHVCKRCGVRPARCISKKRHARKQWRYVKGHDLCRQCFESTADSAKSRSFETAEIAWDAPQVAVILSFSMVADLLKITARVQA